MRLAFVRQLYQKDSANGLPSSDPAALRRHVEHLASACAPRSTDNPAGLDCAADYIQGAFSYSGAEVASPR